MNGSTRVGQIFHSLEPYRAPLSALLFVFVVGLAYCLFWYWVMK